MIRKAEERDIARIAEIYEAILDRQEQGLSFAGWAKGVYPTEETARGSVRRGEMYVLEEDGAVAAAARINRDQGKEYAVVNWLYPAPAEKVMVLHTLVVAPECEGHGYAHRMMKFYEDMARAEGDLVLRMDTNLNNLPARRMYAKLGYRETAVVNTVFNNIPDTPLVCMEKKL